MARAFIFIVLVSVTLSKASFPGKNMALIDRTDGGLDDIKLKGMIDYTRKMYPYLQTTSTEAIFALSKLMSGNPFAFDAKPTPLYSAIRFLRKIKPEVFPLAPDFEERDFVFAIKMFSCKLRDKNGVYQIVPDGLPAPDVDEEVRIDNKNECQTVEYHIVEGFPRTKIQRQAIDSATNKLLREWRERLLGREFAKIMREENMTIGKAKEWLMANCGVKDHQFVRIRNWSIMEKLFVPSRASNSPSRRVTLDEDVVPFLESMMRHSKSRTLTQAVNQSLRDLKKLTSSVSAAR